MKNTKQSRVILFIFSWNRFGLLGFLFVCLFGFFFKCRYLANDHDLLYLVPAHLILTHKDLERQECLPSTVATDALC